MVVGRAGGVDERKGISGKKAIPLVEKLKEVVKSRTIKCVQLAEQSNIIDRLQEKVSDLGHLVRYLGRERVQSIAERAKHWNRQTGK